MIERKVLTASHPALLQDPDPVAMKDDGRFTGYASTFSNVDLGSDVVVEGAFSMPDGSEFPFLDHHQQSSPVGLLAVSKDSRGLRVTGQLNLEVQRAREIRSLMKQGALTGLSIGYEVKDSYRKGGVRYLTSIALLEVSAVTFPMNPKARITGVKAAARQEEEAREIAKLQAILDDMKAYCRRRSA
jgi:HK97 family phage prohead protease